ncbi:MAG: TonB family protein [Rhizomicrobium sp.]
MSAHSKPMQMALRPSGGALVQPRLTIGGGAGPDPLPPANGGVAHSIFGSRVRADFARYGMSALVAFCLHIAIALVCLLEWMSTPAMPSQSAALMVDLAPTPSSPTAVFKETPPGPHQVQAQPKPQPQQKPQPRIKQPPVMHGEVVLHEDARKTPPAPPDRPPAPRSTDAPTSVAPKNDVAAAPASGAASDPARTAEESWEGAILAKLERAKRYPGLAQMRAEEDVVYLRFTVDRSGQVLTASIDRSRGFALLDDEVLSLIRRVQPLPPPPVQVKGDSIELVVPVEFFIRHGR